jgi:hypothetical protein
MKTIIEHGVANKDCPYCYSSNGHIVCSDSPKCEKQIDAETFLGKVVKKLYDAVEKKLIERLTLMGVDINEQTAKRITRIIDSKSIDEFRHQFWLDYNTAQQQLLFLVYHDYEKAMLCFKNPESKPLGGTPIKEGEFILRNSKP